MEWGLWVNCWDISGVEGVSQCYFYCGVGEGRSKWKKTVCLCRHRPKIKGSKRILTTPKPSRQNLWNRRWIKKCPGRSKGTNFMSFNRVADKKFCHWRLVSQKNSTTNPRGNSLGRDVLRSMSAQADSLFSLGPIVAAQHVSVPSAVC
jgi:hypothetical protein